MEKDKKTTIGAKIYEPLKPRKIEFMNDITMKELADGINYAKLTGEELIEILNCVMKVARNITWHPNYLFSFLKKDLRQYSIRIKWDGPTGRHWSFPEEYNHLFNGIYDIMLTCTMLLKLSNKKEGE